MFHVKYSFKKPYIDSAMHWFSYYIYIHCMKSIQFKDQASLASSYNPICTINETLHAPAPFSMLVSDC